MPQNRLEFPQLARSQTASSEKKAAIKMTLRKNRLCTCDNDEMKRERRRSIQTALFMFRKGEHRTYSNAVAKNPPIIVQIPIGGAKLTTITIHFFFNCFFRRSFNIVGYKFQQAIIWRYIKLLRHLFFSSLTRHGYV